MLTDLVTCHPKKAYFLSLAHQQPTLLMGYFLNMYPEVSYKYRTKKNKMGKLLGYVFRSILKYVSDTGTTWIFFHFWSTQDSYYTSSLKKKRIYITHAFISVSKFVQELVLTL